MKLIALIQILFFVAVTVVVAPVNAECTPDDTGLVCNTLRKAEQIVKKSGKLAELVIEYCETAVKNSDKAAKDFCDEAL